MQERQMQAIKKSLSENRKTATLSAVYALELIREIEGRDCVISDLQQEQPAFELGRKAGLNESLALLRRLRAEHQSAPIGYPGVGNPTQESLVNLGHIQMCNEAIDGLLRAGGLRGGQWYDSDHPAAVRHECDRLRRALEKIATGSIPGGNTAAFHAAVVLKEK